MTDRTPTPTYLHTDGRTLLCWGCNQKSLGDNDDYHDVCAQRAADNIAQRCSHGPGCQLPWSLHDWSYEAGDFSLDPTVCVIHWRFVPCRTQTGCVYSQEPEDVQRVSEYQKGATKSEARRLAIVKTAKCWCGTTNHEHAPDCGPHG